VKGGGGTRGEVASGDGRREGLLFELLQSDEAASEAESVRSPITAPCKRRCRRSGRRCRRRRIGQQRSWLRLSLPKFGKATTASAKVFEADTTRRGAVARTNSGGETLFTSTSSSGGQTALD
jgi:hypothetical protein